VLNLKFDSCRHFLLDPLFKLLSKVFSEEWVNGTLSLGEESSQTSSNPSETVNHIQQTLLIILEDIITSLKSIAVVNLCFLIVKLAYLYYNRKFKIPLQYFVCFLLLILITHDRKKQ
jgi:hypothetical protein